MRNNHSALLWLSLDSHDLQLLWKGQEIFGAVATMGGMCDSQVTGTAFCEKNQELRSCSVTRVHGVHQYTGNRTMKRQDNTVDVHS